MNNQNLKITFPHPPGSGGPGSFQIRFEKELSDRGWDISYAGEKGPKPDLVFVVGGTRRLFWLVKMKRRGIPIVYRLDGISWLHKKKYVGLRNYALAEFGNWSSKFIHAFLADRVIYQSQFVKDWWDRSGWKSKKKTTIVYNGVQIPQETERKTSTAPGKKRLVILEGTLDYSPYAVDLINDLAENLPKAVEVEVYGRFEDPANEKKIDKKVNYYGFLKREEVMEVLRGSVYLSLDINPACPNTVIEAMACGAPVVAFDTGAISEIVDNQCGAVVPYGSDPWKLGIPNVEKLKQTIIEVFNAYELHSDNAFKKAINNFSIDMMIEAYTENINLSLV